MLIFSFLSSRYASFSSAQPFASHNRHSSRSRLQVRAGRRPLLWAFGICLIFSVVDWILKYITKLEAKWSNLSIGDFSSILFSCRLDWRRSSVNSRRSIRLRNTFQPLALPIMSFFTGFGFGNAISVFDIVWLTDSRLFIGCTATGWTSFSRTTFHPLVVFRVSKNNLIRLNISQKTHFQRRHCFDPFAPQVYHP